VRWIGKHTLTGGRLEIGRYWITWRGWRRPAKFRIGSTRVVCVGPLAVFIHQKGTR
jgi:hypothetical protein